MYLSLICPKDSEPDDRGNFPYEYLSIIKEKTKENKIIGDELDRRLKLIAMNREKSIQPIKYDYIVTPSKKLSDSYNEDELKRQSVNFSKNETTIWKI